MGNHHRRRGHLNRPLALLLATGVLLAACSGAVSTPEQPDSAPVPGQIQTTVPPLPTEEAPKQLDAAPEEQAATEPAVAPTTELAPTEVPQATATAEEAPVVVRTDLQASNPAEFALASGGYQFVEFFAFW